MTTLDAHIRGDTFIYESSLGNGWVGSDFTGGVKFTLRTKLPGNSVTTDTDRTVVDQASVATGEIAFTGANFRITIPKERTTLWPVKTLHWDLQCVISGVGGYATTVDSGTIAISADVTREY